MPSRNSTLLACLLLAPLAARAEGPARWLRPSRVPYPAEAGAGAYALASVGGRLVFAATDAANGTEMWTSDGTAEGTHVLVDAYPGPDLLAQGGVGNDPRLNPCPGPGMKTNGVLVFASSDPGPGNLWRTDSTGEGTFPLFEPLDPEAPHLEGPHFPTTWVPSFAATSFGGPAFFVATNVKGPALWRSDGTRRGTFSLVDLPSSNEMGTELTAVPGGAVFQRSNGAGGFELWTSDGSRAGTKPVATFDRVWRILGSDDRTTFLTDYAVLWSVDLATGQRTALKPAEVAYASAMVKGSLVFSVADAGAEAGLWTSDGTVAGTVRIGDVQPWTIVARGSDAIVAGYDGAGMALWRTDGTSAGTSKIRKFPSAYPEDGSSYLRLTAIGERVWFSMIQIGSPSTPQIWATDGTDAGTLLVTTATTGRNFVEHGGKTFFIGKAGQLWVVGGPGSDARRVASIGTPSPTTHVRLLAVDGRVAYFADDRTNGSELWRTDGTPQGTTLVHRFEYDIGRAAVLDRALVFVARDGSGTAIWRYDGAMVRSLAALPLAPWTGSVSGFARLGDALFVQEAGSPGAFALWRTDGSVGGTYSVEAFPATVGAASIGEPGVARAGSRILFPAADSTRSTYRLLATRGGRAEAEPIGTLEWGSLETVASGALVYFLDPPQPPPTSFGPETRSLWRSDGTAAGTFVLASGDVHDVVPDGAGGAFFARTAEGDVTLWRTDGTTVGTAAWAPQGVSPVAPVAAAHTRVYFVGAEIETGDEIWSADPEARDALLVRNIGPAGVSFDGPNRSIAALHGGGLVFAASDGTYGRELWATNGTPEGTRLIQDLNVGPGSSSPGDFLEACGGIVYFTADVEDIGREPFAIPLSAIDPDARPKPCPVAAAPPASPRPRARP